ncbi:MAG: DUF1800 domain-containing protein [Chthoniobacterales bacterium]
MLTPLPVSRWDESAAAHLLRRAAFGGTPEEIASVHAKGLTRAVNDLLHPATPASETSAPAWAQPRDLRTIRQEARMAKRGGDRSKIKAFRKMEGDEVLDLRSWWLRRLASDPAPLREKMTLFWHGHFATSMEKVKDGYWMWRQNQTLREHALGNFNSLTKAISRDPAMMIYLDLPQSRPEHPNENWAREMMELFTIGIGHYGEPDVKEAARAFTGYRLDLASQTFRFAPRQHDDGSKTFLGRTGNFGGDEIIDILTAQPACAEFIAKKLCRFFVEDDPAPALVDTVAGRLGAHGLELLPILREIFTSTEFYAERVQRAQIKSPTQFMVETCRLLLADLPSPRVAQNAMRQMGQILFAPPNVKGWDGGKSWISTSTLLFRNNFANYLINGDAIVHPAEAAAKRAGADLGFRRNAAALAQEIKRAPIDVGKIVPPELRKDPERLLAVLIRRIFQSELPTSELAAFREFLSRTEGEIDDVMIRGLLHLMMSTPLYQLT